MSALSDKRPEELHHQVMHHDAEHSLSSSKHYQSKVRLAIPQSLDSQKPCQRDMRYVIDFPMQVGLSDLNLIATRQRYTQKSYSQISYLLGRLLQVRN